MSGLVRRSAVPPMELKELIRPPVGFGATDCSSVKVMVTPSFSSASSASRAPSSCMMPTVGTVIAGSPATLAFSAPGSLL